jgi:hypothetical protein
MLFAWSCPMDPRCISEEILEVLNDLARGTIHRSRHGLVLDGRDCTAAFEEALRDAGFVLSRVRDLEIPAGTRFPGFLLRNGVAHFGHVFREKFTEGEDRVLFGSVVRDWRGDWEIMLTRRSAESVWVNLEKGVPFDDERPSGGV